MVRKTDWTQEELQQRKDTLEQLLSEGILFSGPCYDTVIQLLYAKGYQDPEWDDEPDLDE